MMHFWVLAMLSSPGMAFWVTISHDRQRRRPICGLCVQAATAAAAKAATLQQEADKAALQTAKKASRLEDQLRAAKAEQEVLVKQSEEASAKVAAAQAARDRAVKEV